MNITCTSCPMGCQMSVETENNRIKSIKGNVCKRGESYAESELFDPRRMLTTTVTVTGGGLVPVKSANPLPKHSLFHCMKVIKRTRVKRPVFAGETIVTDILGTGIDIIACDDFT